MCVCIATCVQCIAKTCVLPFRSGQVVFVSTLLVVCSWGEEGGGGHVALSFRRSDQCCVSLVLGHAGRGVIPACMEHSWPLHRLNPPTTWLILGMTPEPHTHNYNVGMHNL